MYFLYYWGAPVLSIHQQVIEAVKNNEDKIYYFAFGSNMLSKVINRHRQVATHSKSIALLNDYALVFNARGLPIIEPGFANIAPVKNARVWGVAYLIERADWLKIIATEGKDYSEHEVEVETETGDRVRAVTLYATENLVSNKRPSKRYHSIVLEGAIESQLPKDYIDELKRTETTHIPVVSTLFTLALNIVVKPVLFRIYRATRL